MLECQTYFVRFPINQSFVFVFFCTFILTLGNQFFLDTNLLTFLLAFLLCSD